MSKIKQIKWLRSFIQIWDYADEHKLLDIHMDNSLSQIYDKFCDNENLPKQCAQELLDDLLSDNPINPN